MKITLRPSDSTHQFDLFVSVLGYEERAIFAPERYHSRSKQILALKFLQRQNLNFAHNEKWYNSINATILEYNGEVSAKSIEEAIDSVFDADTCGEIEIGVDVSSMSRPMIAQVLMGIAKIVEMRSKSAKVTVVYCPASYAEPPDVSPPIAKQGPVIPALAGWPEDSSFPAVAIFGLGYEKDYALGTSEYLEVSSSFAFFPTGEDSRYDKSVAFANRTFLELIGARKVLQYRVEDPQVTYSKLESLLAELVRSYRVILVPFGPKIFAALAVLLALRFSRKVSMPLVSVWRVSGDQTHQAIERKAKGNIIQFCVVFTPDSDFSNST